MDKEIDINMQGKGIVETPYAKLWIKENILYGVFANQLDIDLNMAKKL
jgi:hypothetical protein